MADEADDVRLFRLIEALRYDEGAKEAVVKLVALLADRGKRSRRSGRLSNRS